MLKLFREARKNSSSKTIGPLDPLYIRAREALVSIQDDFKVESVVATEQKTLAITLSSNLIPEEYDIELEFKDNQFDILLSCKDTKTAMSITDCNISLLDYAVRAVVSNQIILG